MARLHRVRFKDHVFTARSGQILLDAATIAGVDIPHDCRAGRCGACLTRVQRGITLDGQSVQQGYVHACKARIFSDLAIDVEETPEQTVVGGKVIAVNSLTADVAEVVVSVKTPLTILAGQYCRFRFAGYPSRAYSPTAPLTRLRGDGFVRLNVKRVRHGRVSSAIGKRIKHGHGVTIEGPYGHAYHRSGKSGRLVLVGTGTGFAPVWSVAAAALIENPARPIVLVGGARDTDGLYMAPALALASQFPAVTAIACADDLSASIDGVVSGPVTAHLPGDLGESDTVYVAGSPKLVQALAEVSRASGAAIYCDPFEAQPVEDDWFDRARQWLRLT